MSCIGNTKDRMPRPTFPPGRPNGPGPGRPRRPVRRRLPGRALALVAGLGLAAAAAAPNPRQDFMVQVFGAEQGLAPASVTDIAQTPDGYLWVGTLLSGLMRFDGTRFESFSTLQIPGLRSASVRRLLVDHAGRLWINSLADTLVTWTPAGFTTANTNATRPQKLLWSNTGEVVFALPDGALLRGRLDGTNWHWTTSLPAGAGEPTGYVAAGDGTLFYTVAGTRLGVWRKGEATVQDPPGLEGQRIAALTATRDGQVWAGTDRSLSRWAGGRFVDATPPDPSGPLRVVRMAATGPADLWVEANGRLRRYHRGAWVAESLAWREEYRGLPGLRLNQGDAEGGLWRAYAGEGLLRVHPDGAVSRLTTSDGLPSNAVRLLFEDAEGNTWTGYERGGLVQIRPRIFQAFGPEQGLTDAVLTSVCTDREGAVWVGTLGGAVARIQDGQSRVIASTFNGQYVPNVVVTADPAGEVWVAPFGQGLWRFQDGQLRQVVAQESIGRYVRLLFVTRENTLWVATMDSIFRLREGVPERVFRAGGSGSAQYLAALAETAEGTLYAGTFGGLLLRWEDNRFLTLSPPERERLGRLWAMQPTADGSLWIGTSLGGLLRFKHGEFRRFTERDGLPPGPITHLLADHQDQLWLGTRAGIARLSLAEVDRLERGESTTLRVSLYTRSDGLPTTSGAFEFQPNSWRGPDGRLWFALLNGVTSVDPAQVRTRYVAPTVTLEELRVDGEKVWPRAAGAVRAARPTGSAADPPEPREAIRLRPGRRDLEFQFSGLSFASPEQVRFRYQLEGFAPEWSAPGTERAVVYRRVPPGNYRFHVQAANRDGVWTPEAVSLAVVVPPHYWQTAWFRLGVAALLVGALALAVRHYSLRRVRARLQRLEAEAALQRERQRIARDIHDDAGASLTQIALLSELAQSDFEKPALARRHIDAIFHHAHALTRALDEIVWSLNPKHDTLESLINRLCKFAPDFLAAAGVRCRVDVPTDLPARPLPAAVRHHLYLAIKEALHNVAKHAAASEVWLRVTLNGQTVELVVEDNGRGTPPAAAADAAEADGLANLRQRMAEVGGAFAQHARPGGGTGLRFTVPLPGPGN